MIKIKVVCVGKIKEKYFTDGIGEYSKRLGGYCSFEIIEVKEEKIVDFSSNEKIKEIEGKRILEKINDKDYVILLDLKGKELTSEELSNKLEELIDSGRGNIAFIIGGSLGVSNEIKERANYSICFSKLTFPHQMIRLFLCEQIYRSFKIINNETYHK